MSPFWEPLAPPLAHFGRSNSRGSAPLGHRGSPGGPWEGPGCILAPFLVHFGVFWHQFLSILVHFGMEKGSVYDYLNPRLWVSNSCQNGPSHKDERQERHGGGNGREAPLDISDSLKHSIHLFPVFL